MEDQYGEHYAQKVEDRLLHYLHKLETVLPGDTCADKILRQGSPVTQEEKMLIEVLASDSASIATTLKKLLHCDVASCHPDGVSWSSEDEIDQTTVKSYLPETDVSQDHRSFSENDNDSDLRRHQQTEEDGEKVKRVEEESGDRGRAEISQRGGEGVQSTTSPPQFCSKHQRWVKSILQECHVECSEELQLKASVFSSPLLFQSSSSGSSSEDLTPSNLIPSPCDQQHPPVQTVVQTSEQANSEVKMHPETGESENNTFQPEPPHLPTSKRDTLQPSMLSPVIRLIDIASIDQFLPLFECHETSPNHHQQAASSSSPQILTSGGEAIPRKTVKDSPCNQSEALVPKSPPYPALTGKSAHISQDQFTSTCCTTTTQACSSRNLKRSRPACTSDSQAMDRLRVDRSAQTTFGNCCPFNASGPLKQEPSTSQSGNRSSVCIANSVPLHGGLPQHVVLQSSESLPQKHTIPSNSLPPYKVISSTLNSNCSSATAETSRVQKHPLKLSLRSQTLLLQSKLLQPSVSVVRLSRQECCRVTGRRSSPGHVEQPVEQGSSGDNTEDRRMEEGENEESSFDVNFLYSSSSSNSEGDNSQVCDPDYEPNIKRRLLLEYEAARSMNYT
ncbi:A-agglutinin anchorage subunit isoform X5 [Xyrichtys novacula]|nr:A-agglutinin anchorage subunit isoform X5 [Xyrichtys novacula]